MTSTSPLLTGRSAHVLQSLRQMLESASYQPGSKLPPERELAATLTASRRVLRQALDILEQEGRLERVPGRGTVVLAPRMPLHSLENLTQHTSPIELMDARFVLEPAIAAAAAVHASSHDLETLSHCFEQTKQVRSHAEWEHWDSALHKALGMATHNSLLVHFYDVLTHARAQTEWGRLRRHVLTPEVRARYTEQHARILNAVRERSPEEAAQAMREHLSLVRRTLQEQLEAMAPAVNTDLE